MKGTMEPQMEFWGLPPSPIPFLGGWGESADAFGSLCHSILPKLQRAETRQLDEPFTQIGLHNEDPHEFQQPGGKPKKQKPTRRGRSLAMISGSLVPTGTSRHGTPSSRVACSSCKVWVGLQSGAPTSGNQTKATTQAAARALQGSYNERS